jgi:hypothetical protein
MNIELTEFTFDFKLNKLLKLNLNPISFQKERKYIKSIQIY